MSQKEKEQFNLELSEHTHTITPRVQHPKKPTQSGLSMLVYAGQIGVSVLVPLLGGVGIGRYVDQQQGTRPLFVLIGLGIGFLLSLVTLFATVREIIRKI
jgi:ATP synthase protein I